MSITRRAYLSQITDSEGKPLATATGRGRFSVAAMAALETARNNGITFSDDVKADKPVSVKSERSAREVVTKIEIGSFDPKAVRIWAASNGITVNARGRLAHEVVRAYQTANPDLSTEEKTVVRAGKDTRPHASMLHRKSTRWVGHDRKGKRWSFGYREACACGKSLGWCACGTPVVLDMTVEPLVTASLV
jgi:hypothetical protein